MEGDPRFFELGTTELRCERLMAGLCLRASSEEGRLHTNGCKNVVQSHMGNTTSFMNLLRTGPSFRLQLAC